jgi:hypothetical protein
MGELNGVGNGRREGAKKRKYFPAEYTALRLLEYMIGNEKSGPFSVYRLMWIEGIRRQRRDRIRLILGRLVESGFVEAVPGNSTCYQASEIGKMEYPWIKGVLMFFDGKFEKQRRPPSPASFGRYSQFL